MLSRLVAVLVGWGTGRSALIAFIALVLGGVLLFQFAPYEELKSRVKGAPLPEEGASYEGGIESFLRELGDDGRSLYLRFQVWDLLNPILLGTAFTLLIGWLVNRAHLQHHVARFAILVPLFVATADVVENLLLMDGIASFPGAGAGTALTPAVTAAKFIGLLLMVASAAFLMVAAVIVRWRRVS